MKKLHNKIFYLIYGLLTLLLVTILFISTYTNYNREKNDVLNMLQRIDTKTKNDFGNNPPPEMENNETPPEPKERIFIDAIAYTVTLDSNNNPTNIISNHETSSTINEEEIEKILATKPIQKNHVNNLYLNKYIYSLSADKSTMYILDVSSTRKALIEDLRNFFIIFLIGELIIFFLSSKITNWIIKPVEESFNKQKEFIADASHELKTPLAVITSNIDMIEGKKDDKKWIDNIKNESDRMNKLIINLLDLAKLESQNNVEKTNINLSKIFEKTILPFEGIMFEKNIKLSYDIPDNIEFICDEEQIKELIVILIDNAIKHSKGKVIANLKKDRKNIIMEITNSGDPIPEGDEEKIFERFYKVDKSRNRKDNNYGLGLAIAKSIVTENNGVITAESKNGLTTFKILFKTK